MHGETLVLPNLSYKHKDWDLTFDEQTRCLSYIAHHLNEFCTLPQGLKARVLSVPSITRTLRADTAEGYPGISLYAEENVSVDIRQIPNPLELENKLNTWIEKTGKQKLLELSSAETLTWDDVVRATNQAEQKVRVAASNNLSEHLESFEEWATRLANEERRKTQ